MAFETFLTDDKQKPKKSRRVTFAVSLAAHGVLLAVGVATSFASVEELGSTTRIPITIGALPTPPPPPAGRKPKPKTTPKPKTITQPHRNVLTVPTERPPEAKDDDEGGTDPNGTDDGDKNSPGGGGPGQGETVTKFLSPNVTKGYLAINPQEPQHRPHMPPGFAGRTVSALLRVCTDRDGNVIEVTVMKGFDPSVDAAFVAALRTWRYRPFLVDGRAVPFCTPVNYSVQTTN
ncbi:MAG TPA: energy transducer TonB [Polyangia bacterium]|nr:energy transducer TonB [Polyangia bacterium]